MPDRAPPVPHSPGRLALPVALVYAAFGITWIVSSDRLLSIWVRDPELLTRMQTWKGMAFVLVTSLLLWWLARAGFALQDGMRAQLSRREHDWRAMFDDNPLPMWVCARASGRMLAVNDAATRHYGYTRPEFMALTVADLERAPANAAEVAAGIAPADGCGDVRRHYRQGGEALEVEVLMRDTEFGGCSATLVLVHDVSARCRIERRLAVGEARLQLAMHATGLGLWEYAVARDTVESDEQVARMLARPREAFHESRAEWVARAHPDDAAAVCACFRAYLAGEADGYCSEFRMRNDHGEYRWFRSVGRIVERDEAGRPARVVGTCLDITAQVLTRQELEGARRLTEQAAALARQSELSSRLLGVQEEERRKLARELHDEIGQQLTALIFNLHALAREGASDWARERLADCRAIVDHTLASIRDRVLDLRPPMLDDLGLGPAVQSYCRRQAERAGVRIMVAGADALGRHARQTETVAFRTVQEAVNNALRHGAPAQIRVRLTVDGANLTVWVEDDGSGFADASPPDGHRGLGLAGMRERVALAGGGVEIDSAAGQGTRIRVTLPLAQGARA